jgi:3-dehydroquinate synthase
MATIKVDLDTRSYEIVIETGILARAGEEIKSIYNGNTAMVVTDSTVGPLYIQDIIASLSRAGFRPFTSEIPAGEESKTLASALSLYNRLLDAHMDRTSIIVTLGGGVMGDLGGFVAATYLRGIDFVQIPTTLLAQVDASIGGKVGVDLPRGKNLVGAFHQPKRVLIDPDVLSTLPRREFVGGLAELIKHGIIAGQELFDFVRSQADELLRLDRSVLEKTITQSCQIKASVVSRDERESGIRAILNYGHTIGHGIETATGFNRYTHGEGVSIGMVTSALIAEEISIAECGIANEIADVLSKVGLPIAMDADINPDDVIRFMTYDKKILFGKLRFILPKTIGEVIVTDVVTEPDVRKALSEQSRLFGSK